MLTNKVFTLYFSNRVTPKKSKSLSFPFLLVQSLDVGWKASKLESMQLMPGTFIKICQPLYSHSHCFSMVVCLIALCFIKWLFSGTLIENHGTDDWEHISKLDNPFINRTFLCVHFFVCLFDRLLFQSAVQDYWLGGQEHA